MSHSALELAPARSRSHRARWRGLILFLAPLLAVGACYSRSHNNVVSAPGQRFQLVVEAGRTDVDGTHFLVDAATGDLWRLDPARPGPDRWVRVSEGPAAAAELPPLRLPFDEGETPEALPGRT